MYDLMILNSPDLEKCADKIFSSKSLTLLLYGLVGARFLLAKLKEFSGKRKLASIIYSCEMFDVYWLLIHSIVKNV